jgi:Glyoxalase-like domain
MDESQALGRPADDGPTQECAAIGVEYAGGHAMEWMSHKVSEAKPAKNRMHLDIHVEPDREADDVARLTDLGAELIDTHDDRGLLTHMKRLVKVLLLLCLVLSGLRGCGVRRAGVAV